VSLSATYTYTSSILIVSAPGGTLPSNELVNLNINWKGVGGSPIDATFFATNVTKEKYYAGINDQSRTGFVSQTVAEPRIYGARLRYNF
jgi:iron complex outermembrane receptor protein